MKRMWSLAKRTKLFAKKSTVIKQMVQPIVGNIFFNVFVQSAIFLSLYDDDDEEEEEEG